MIEFKNRRLIAGLGLCLLGLVLAPDQGIGQSPAEDFERTIAPLLAARCLDCHNAADKKGGLDLTSRQAAETGGENGAVFEPGDPDSSYFWQRVEADEMPPKKPLSDAEKAILKAWIVGGAKWGAGPIDRLKYTTDTRAGYDWWALQPLARERSQESGVRSQVSIDAFIAEKRAAKNLSPAPVADRRTLIRRVTFDLLGLPPSPEDVAAFMADKAPDAYERLVDRLLASPHYGERWARHWLDVARFGESDGFEYDKLRPNAWPYRDWVVQALNNDMPYDEFARMQIAGDVEQPNDAAAITATGFLVCGAHDSLLPAGDVMRQIMRQDEMEDLVGTVSQTFLGLTVNCARCHDHKFDPIRQSEYYRLSAALAGVARGDRDLPVPPAANVESLKSQLAVVQAELNSIDEPARAAILAERDGEASPKTGSKPLLHWSFQAGMTASPDSPKLELLGGARMTDDGLVLNGQDAYAQTAPLDRVFEAKTLEAWVQLENLTQGGGAAISLQTIDGGSFDAIVFGERQPSHWMAGSEGFRRTQDLAAPAETSAKNEIVHLAITYAADGTITLFRNGAVYGKAYKPGPLLKFKTGSAHLVFGLRHSPPGSGKMLAGIVKQASLYDRALTAEELAASAGTLNRVVTDKQVSERLTSEQRSRREALADQSRKLESQINPASQKAFVVTPVAAAVTHRLERGNPLTKGEVVTPGGVGSVAGPAADFGLEPNAADDDRRKRLADWIASKDNPLFARVMVNRVWHHHFGVGIVETPNDFGFSGGRPSHPELLDWLAGKFVHSGFRLKPLHRLIVNSATYRQESITNAEAQKIDAGNRLLWRFTPRRLEAETVRDAVLAVSGQLNPRMSGPGFQDFDLQNQANTAVYIPRDADGPDFQRRSLYRTWARGARHPLLDTFDCPDTSVTSPNRGVTTTPLQALSLLNNSFMLRMSDHFAARVIHKSGDQISAQVQRAYELAYGRAPTGLERDRVEPFAKQHGLAALCRVLFNSNEFLYVE